MSVDELTAVVGLVSAILLLWWRVESKVSSAAKDALTLAQQVQKDLHEFELEVADHYVKNGYLKDVESRLLGRLDALVSEIHGMRKDVQDAVVKIASSPSRRR